MTLRRQDINDILNGKRKMSDFKNYEIKDLFLAVELFKDSNTSVSAFMYLSLDREVSMSIFNSILFENGIEEAVELVEVGNRYNIVSLFDEEFKSSVIDFLDFEMENRLENALGF